MNTEKTITVTSPLLPELEEILINSSEEDQRRLIRLYRALPSIAEIISD